MDEAVRMDEPTTAPKGNHVTKPRPAPIESGAVETEMRTGDMPEESQDAPGEAEPNGADIEQAQNVTVFPERAMPTGAELSGPEMAEIRVRNEAVDRANRDAKTAQDEALQKTRLAQYAQEALTAGITNLIRGRGLDPNHRYQVNMERGRIESLGQFQMPPPPEE